MAIHGHPTREGGPIMIDTVPEIRVVDFNSTNGSLLKEALHGLKQNQKILPCKLFYDEVGSSLFDQICGLNEYYPTRTELGILQRHVGEIVRRIGPEALLIEYGCGNCVKTRLLLNALDRPAGYIPIDISRDYLVKTAQSLAADFPHIEVVAVCGDYTAPLDLPSTSQGERRRVAFFPGSTIGNFHPVAARSFLVELRRQVGDSGGLLIGVDLKKDRGLLYRAYNDTRGVTARFNLNALQHLNHECGTDFDLAGFAHQAVYNEKLGRIEMHLVSLRPQRVRLNGASVSFQPGETIRTECAYKYSLRGFRRLAESAGFRVAKVWRDPENLFSVQYLEAAE